MNFENFFKENELDLLKTLVLMSFNEKEREVLIKKFGCRFNPERVGFGIEPINKEFDYLRKEKNLTEIEKLIVSLSSKRKDFVKKFVVLSINTYLRLVNNSTKNAKDYECLLKVNKNYELKFAKIQQAFHTYLQQEEL